MTHLRCAIYARKSTEEATGDPSRSVQRQVSHAREYATKKGWEAVEGHVYVDDGVSGGEFKNRPGLLRLLNALKPKPPFDAVLMTEASRLGRERLSTEMVARELSEAGVRIFYCLTDEEERLDTPEARFIMAARGFASEMEREKAKLRTRDALLARAKRGLVTGGGVYGFRNVPIYAGTDASGNPQRSHVLHEIEPDEAEIVRNIFRMFADGYGLKTIAKTLNADPSLAEESGRYFGSRRVPPPRKGSGSWAPSCIAAILGRERYRGCITWGKYRNTDRGGRTRCRVRQAKDTWQTTEVSELRIVGEELWQAVQHRREENRVRYKHLPATAQFELTSRVSRSLLSGLSSCTACGGSIIISGSKNNAPCYGCGHYRNRGSTVCANKLLESVATVDRRLLEEIERTVLKPEARRFALERAAEIVNRNVQGRDDQLPALERELLRIRREIDNLLRAVETGKAPASVLDRLNEKEKAAARVESEIRSLKTATRVSPINLRRIDRVLEDCLGRFSETLRGDLVRGRQALSKLLVGRVQFTPTEFPEGEGPTGWTPR